MSPRHLTASSSLSPHPHPTPTCRLWQVKASWEDATRELLAQYEETIEANLPARETLASFIGNLDSLLRAGLVSLFAWCLMRAYTARFLKMFLGVRALELSLTLTLRPNPNPNPTPQPYT